MEEHLHHGHEVRKAHHQDKFKKDLVNRLNRVEGQVRGISRMVEEDVYCDDILAQISSVESALNGIKKVLLEAHVKSCVIDDIRAGKEEAVGGLLVTLGRMLK